jgi:dihydroxyacetone kinase
VKKLLNNVVDVVPEMLEGNALGHPGLGLLEGENIVLRTDVREMSGRVAIVTGGGSGHEPAHTGYLGSGMLTAAVCGEVFTSPSADAVLAAIRAVASPAGVLLIVKNYTGDRLNFGLAAELARAEGIAVETVVVGDDVALTDADDTAGRRGLAGTVLVHKVAGAAAEAGAPLERVRAEAAAVAAAVGTMGVGLTPCTVPAAGRPGFELGADEVELGLGIHGEPGVRRIPLASADELVEVMLDRIVTDRGLASGDRVALLVNNLGGTPAMEIQIVLRSALRNLAERGITVERAWSGGFLTALEMAGCSLSLLAVDDDVLARLDAPAQASAWPAAHLGRVRTRPRRVPQDDSVAAPAAATAAGGENAELGRVITAVCKALADAEPLLTELDSAVGDGDLGISLARGAEAVMLERSGYPADPAGVLRGLSGTLRRALGGTSGPLYAVFLLRAAAVLDEAPQDWARAAAEGAEALGELGGARVGDRTMLDALVPAAQALLAAAAEGAEPAEAARRAVESAHAGAASTAWMTPRRGRSSYLGERAVGHVDPGAKAVAIWLTAVEGCLR